MSDADSGRVLGLVEDIVGDRYMSLDLVATGRERVFRSSFLESASGGLRNSGA